MQNIWPEIISKSTEITGGTRLKRLGFWSRQRRYYGNKNFFLCDVYFNPTRSYSEARIYQSSSKKKSACSRQPTGCDDIWGHYSLISLTPSYSKWSIIPFGFLPNLLKLNRYILFSNLNMFVVFFFLVNFVTNTKSKMVCQFFLLSEIKLAINSKSKIDCQGRPKPVWSIVSAQR